MGQQRREIDLDTYEDPQIVAHYARSKGLQLPEEALLDRLRPALPRMAMLDIGVGAGRTARHFAPLAGSYLGIDYSKAMIDRCREEMPGVEFAVGDVRNLDFLKSGAFDLALFSYNGIDHVPPRDRDRAFREIIRVLRPGGTLVFSSHNANYVPAIVERFRFRLPLSAGLRETLRALKWSVIFKWHNPLLQFRLPFTEGVVGDGVHSFRSTGYYYIRPDLQVAALRRLGMEEISWAPNDGKEFLLDGDERLTRVASPWVYYVCRKIS